MSKTKKAKTSVHDTLAIKVSELLKGVQTSAKIEALILYLYDRKPIPSSLSLAEEKELFSVINKVVDTKEAFILLRDYIERFDVKSKEAIAIFNSLKRSFEIDANFKAEESGLDSEAMADYVVFTPPSPEDLSEENIKLTDEEVAQIIQEVEDELNAENS